ASPTTARVRKKRPRSEITKSLSGPTVSRTNVRRAYSGQIMTKNPAVYNRTESETGPPLIRPRGLGALGAGLAQPVLADLGRLQQIGEQRAEMNESLAQLLGIGAALAIGFGQHARRAVVMNDVGVIYREVRHPLLEILHRVAMSLHDLLDQLIGFA